MKRRLLAIALVMMLFIGMMPTQIWANPTTYEYEIQAVIADENGGWVSTKSLPSKNFKGTTESGSGYNDDWQWKPKNGGYTITCESDTHVNAFGHLKYPTALWEYDSNEYEFIGIGKNSYSTTPAYNLSEADLKYDWKFENLSFNFDTRTGVRTYIFKQKGPVAPDPAISEFSKERLTNEPSDGIITLPPNTTIN